MADFDTLRAAYRHPGSGGDAVHLSEDRWERLACDEMTPEEREAALDHILACPRCSDTHRALQILQSEAVAFDPGAPVRKENQSQRSSSRKGLWGGLSFLALAAAVMMAVVLPTFNPKQPDMDTGTPVLRSAGAPLPATPVAPVDQVIEWRSRHELLLKWTLDPSSHVVIEILDADGELIWTSPETAATEIQWPDDLGVNPGRYYWRVVIVEPAIGRISSDLVSFELIDGGVTASPP